jgi:hypothetical protein
MDNYEWLEGYRSEAKFRLYSIDRNSRRNDDRAQLGRQKTRGAEALAFIIQRSFFENRGGLVTDSAIATAEDMLETFHANC